jgi:hypothetical protein
MSQKTTKTVFKTIGYDLPSENVDQLIPLEGEGVDLDREKRKKQAHTWLRNKRLNFWWDLCNWGRRVNNSVFVVPEDNLKDVDEYIQKTRQDYDKFSAE